jgi:hypothetical protein
LESVCFCCAFGLFLAEMTHWQAMASGCCAIAIVGDLTI